MSLKSSLNRKTPCALGAILLGLGAVAQAHEPIAICHALDDNTVRCYGGYAHGEDAPGLTMDVISYEDDRVLIPGKLGDDSTITFQRPEGGFYVLFDAGPGHMAVVEHDEIQVRRETARR